MKTKRILASLLTLVALGTTVAAHSNPASAEQQPRKIRNYTIKSFTITFNVRKYNIFNKLADGFEPPTG